jgi:predicted amidohydrolase
MIRVAAAQLGPIHASATREATVARLVSLLREASGRGADLVVYPEAALTAFFPHWLIDNPLELESYFEAQMPGPATQPLFEAAAALGIGFYLGFAELARTSSGKRLFNSSILVDEHGAIVGKYRKIHLPGTVEYRPQDPFQNLEKRYFEVGDLGFPVFDAFGGRVGMCICNDRRWPETYRLLGLKGAELILLGYNTPKLNPDADQSPELRMFHNHLSMQAGAYQNGAFVVGVAKAGIEEGCAMMGGSCIIGPDGQILAQASSEDDELIVADCDLDRAIEAKRIEFDVARNRRPELYAGLLDGPGQP